MRRPHPSLPVYGVLILTIALWTTALGQAPPDPFDIAVAAHGGPVVATVQRIRITGQSVRLGVPAPVTISVAADGRVRLDYGRPAERSIIRSATPFEVVNGRYIPKAPHSGAFSELDMFSILGIAPYRTATKTYLGRTTTPEGPIDRYDVRTSHRQTHYRRTLEDRLEVHLDVATGRVVGIAREHRAEKDLDHRFTLSHRFSNFATANGLVFPFRIEIGLNGVMQETMTVNSVELNPGFSGDLFTR